MFIFILIRKKILFIVFYSIHINDIVFCSESNQKQKMLQVTSPIDYILYHNVIETIIKYRERPNCTCCKSIRSKTTTDTTLSNDYNSSHIGHHIFYNDIRRNLHTETDNMLRIRSGNPFHTNVMRYQRLRVLCKQTNVTPIYNLFILSMNLLIFSLWCHILNKRLRWK